jgi:hypothetical protein
MMVYIVQVKGQKLVFFTNQPVDLNDISNIIIEKATKKRENLLIKGTRGNLETNV